MLVCPKGRAKSLYRYRRNYSLIFSHLSSLSSAINFRKLVDALTDTKGVTWKHASCETTESWTIYHHHLHQAWAYSFNTFTITVSILHIYQPCRSNPWNVIQSFLFPRDTLAITFTATFHALTKLKSLQCATQFSQTDLITNSVSKGNISNKPLGN